MSLCVIFLRDFKFALCVRWCYFVVDFVQCFFSVPSVRNCTSNPCKNNSTCVDHINQFVCLCPPGLAGKTCEVDYNECDSSPCKNGATCTDGFNTFTCTCASGFTGDAKTENCIHAGTFSLPIVTRNERKPKLFPKILKSKQFHRKVLLKSFHFNVSRCKTSPADSKVRTTLYSIINSTTGKYCSLTFIIMVTL